MAEEFFRALPGTPTADAPMPGTGGDLPPVVAVPGGGGGLPGADLPLAAPKAGMSAPGGVPPTSGPVSYAVAAAGLPVPVVPLLPTPLADPVQPGSTAPGDPAQAGGYYFLAGPPGYTPAAPAVPGFGYLGIPGAGQPPAPTVPAPDPVPGASALGDPGRFYFLDDRATGVPALPVDPHPAFDVRTVRRDFPILSETVNGRPLIWFDNAATTQKPQAVIDRLARFYSRENSNIHRAAHELAARSTDAYENARRTVARFIGASSTEEIVFVRGATEAINLVAKAWGPKNVGPGEEIIISHLEHHANIVPWQMLAEQTGAVLKVIPVDEDGQVLLDKYHALLSDRTKLVAVTQVSNALGTVVPVREIIELGHRAGATVLVDGAQSVPHLSVDVAALDADFLVFSGHKIFGPTGIGVLYGKREVLADMPPWEGGGNMITDVTLERAVYQPPPERFEAGTGNIADAVGLAAALDYVDRIGLANIAAYEHELLWYATAGMQEVRGLRLIGTAPEKASVLSFVLDGYEPAEVGSLLNEEGIAVRSGHHCAQPILRRYGLEATVRPSLAFYNTRDEVDTLVAALHRISATRR